MNQFLLILGMAFVTFAVRYPVVAMSGKIKLSPQFLQILRYVPPTVLTAIVVPAILMPDNELLIALTNSRLVGAVIAIIVGFWQKNLLLTIVVGMITFFAWQGVLSWVGNNPLS